MNILPLTVENAPILAFCIFSNVVQLEFLAFCIDFYELVVHVLLLLLCLSLWDKLECFCNPKIHLFEVGSFFKPSLDYHLLETIMDR